MCDICAFVSAGGLQQSGRIFLRQADIADRMRDLLDVEVLPKETAQKIMAYIR